MNLKEYLFYTDMSIRDFSLKCSMSPSLLSNMITGKTKPTRKALILIEFASNGSVKQQNAFKPTMVPQNLITDLMKTA